MSESYTLHYFPLGGRAEPIRMILRYGGIPFTDNHIRSEDWLNLKQSMPFKQLPVLDTGEQMIPQTMAICRFLAKKVNLVGHNAEENLIIDSIVDTMTDLIGKMVDYAFEEDESMKIALEEKLLRETLPLFLGRFEKQAKENGGYIALTQLSWADIVFVCIYEDAVNFMKKDILTDYPNLIEVRRNVLNVPAIKEWILSRPKYQNNAFYNLKSDL